MSAWRNIFDGAPSRDLKIGEVLFRREDAVHSMYLVQRGQIALERPMADGTALTLHIALQGTALAEASLFANAYHCDAVARAPATVIHMPKRGFLDALRTSPDAAIELMAANAREVQSQRARIEILRLRRVSDRLDAWLAFEGVPERGGWVRVAEAIGVTQPALYRELARRRAS